MSSFAGDLEKRVLHLTGYGEHDFVSPALEGAGFESFVAASHERLHDEALLQTPFGFFQYCLTAVGHGIPDTASSMACRGWASSLLNASELTHETYATFLSISELPDPIKDQVISSTLKVPLYRELFDDIESAVSTVSKAAMIRSSVASGILRASFACLPAENIDLADLSAVPQFLEDQRSPDTRLARYLRVVREDANQLRGFLATECSAHLSEGYFENNDSRDYWLKQRHQAATAASASVAETTLEWLRARVSDLPVLTEQAWADAFETAASICVRANVQPFSSSILSCRERQPGLELTKVVSLFSHGSFVLRGTGKLPLARLPNLPEEFSLLTVDAPRKVFFVYSDAVQREAAPPPLVRCVYDSSFSITDVAKSEHEIFSEPLRSCPPRSDERSSLSAVVMPVEIPRHLEQEEPFFDLPARKAGDISADQLVIYMQGDFLGWYEYLIRQGPLQFAALGDSNDPELDAFRVSDSTTYGEVVERYHTFWDRGLVLCLFRSSGPKGTFMRFLPNATMNTFSDLLHRDMDNGKLTYWQEQLQDVEAIGRASIISSVIRDLLPSF